MLIEVETAEGRHRAVIYAMWVCNGYNPQDNVFWGVSKNGPGDKAWGIVWRDVAAKLGRFANVPNSLVSEG